VLTQQSTLRSAYPLWNEGKTFKIEKKNKNKNSKTQARRRHRDAGRANKRKYNFNFQRQAAIIDLTV